MNPAALSVPRRDLTPQPPSLAGKGEHGPFRNEPIADFSREDKRRAMQDALQQVAGQFGRFYPLVINGESSPSPLASGGEASPCTLPRSGGEGITWIESRNPSHWEQIAGSCAAPGRGDAERSIAAAKAAFPGWRDPPLAARTALLFHPANAIRR